jgi:hypothetical protein
MPPRKRAPKEPKPEPVETENDRLDKLIKAAGQIEFIESGGAMMIAPLNFGGKGLPPDELLVADDADRSPDDA